MAFLKKHPLFVTLLSVCSLVLLVTLVLTILATNQLSETQKKIRSQVSQRGIVYSLDPAPTEDNLQAAEANVEELLDVLQAQIEVARGSTSFNPEDAPESGSDLFFDLETFRNDFINRAKLVRPTFTDETTDDFEPLQIPSDFAFGFSAYLDAGEPPEDEHVGVVYVQKQVLSHLLNELYEARPLEMIAVRREPAATIFDRRKAEEAATSMPEADDTGLTTLSSPQQARGPRGGNANTLMALKPDEFAMDKNSLRVPGVVRTMAFSITFRGYTQSLRPFLQSLQTYEVPLIVRSVMVKPVESSMLELTANEATDPASEFGFFNFGEDPEPAASEAVTTVDETETTIAVVTDNISEFTVVVEYVEVLTEANTEGVLPEAPTDEVTYTE